MNEWILVDTETDGLMSPIFAVEVAAQRFKGFIPDGDPFRIFIDHGIEIPPAATAVHGYTTDFIKKNGVNPQKAYEQLGGYINGAPIASHYLGFDWNRVLYPEWDRLGIKPLGTRGFCTWRLAKRSLPEYPTHKLDFLRDELDLKCSKAHSALGDIESVEDLLTRIIFPKLLEKGIKTMDGVVEFSLLHPLRCRCLIQDLKYEIELERVESERARQKEEKIANRKEEEARQRFIMDVQTGSYPLPKLINDFDLIEEEPVVCFKDRVFLFTGKMKWGSRSKAGLAVEKMGGKVSVAKQLSLETDYLVLGEDPEDGWTRRVAKLTQAFLRKLKGTNPSFRIILEKDFVDALDSEPIDPPKGEVTAKQRLAEEKRIKEEYYAKRRTQYSINFDDPPTHS